MVDFDPSTFATMSTTQFAQLVQGLSDKEIRTIMAGELREPVISSIVDRFPEQFRPEKAEGVNARVNWRVTGGPGGGHDLFAVVIADGTCQVEREPTEEPTVSLMVGPAEFARLMTGEGNPVMMFMTGKIKLRGNAATALAFQGWFDIPKG